jgi:hypothetical protein
MDYSLRAMSYIENVFPVEYQKVIFIPFNQS